MTLNKIFKTASLLMAGFSFGVAAEKLSAVVKKDEKTEEVADEVTTEDFSSEVAEDSEEE